MNDDCVGAGIYQTWKSNRALPDDFAYWRSTLIEKNSEFSFTLWDDQDNRAFMAKYFPWFLGIYDALPAEIYRVDCVRYFYLYKNGGFYIDLDTECLAPLAKFSSFGGILLGRMGPDPSFPHHIPNAIMASRPREEFWLFLIGLIGTSFRSGIRGAEALTGPIALKTAVDIYLSKEPLFSVQVINAVAKQLPQELKPRRGRSAITLLPQREWYPLDWTDQVHTEWRRIQGKTLLTPEQKKRIFPESSLVTYWAHTWTEPAREQPATLGAAGNPMYADPRMMPSGD